MKRLLLASLLFISIGMTAQKFEIVNSCYGIIEVVDGNEKLKHPIEFIPDTGTITIDRNLVIFDMDSILTVFIKDGEYESLAETNMIDGKKSHSIEIKCAYRRAITNEKVYLLLTYMDLFMPAFELDRTLWIRHGDVMEGYTLKQICQ